MLDKQTTHTVGWTLHDGSLVQVFVEYQELGQVCPAEIPTGEAQVAGKAWLPARWLVPQHGCHFPLAQSSTMLCALNFLRLLEPGLQVSSLPQGAFPT